MGEYVGGYCEGPHKFFNQSLFEESSVAKHRLGTIRELDDGRKFAYALAGEALSAGFAIQSAVPDTLATEIAVASTAAVNDAHVHVTYGAGTTAVANYFRDGFLLSGKVAVYPGPMYKVRGHAAATSGGTLKVDLYDKIREELTTDCYVSLIRNPQAGVLKTVAAAVTGAPAGVAPIDVTSGYYFWNQVKGICSVALAGNAVVGDPLIATSTAGALGPGTAATDTVFGYVAMDGTDTWHIFMQLSIPGY